MAESIEPPGGATTVVPDPAHPTVTQPASEHPAKPNGLNGKPVGKPTGSPNGNINGNTNGKPAGKPTGKPTGNKPRQKYALPLPVRTFPLPTFYPSNPLSLVHLAWVWASQVLGPPSALPAQKVYTGVWCPATRSVQVTDPASMADLWCQGFFGKGSLSRSEPSWLTRERERDKDRATSEQRTNLRREERADSKWERGRAALEAIEKRKQEEAAAAAAAAAVAVAATTRPVIAERGLASPVHNCYTFKPPVGPRELLALPNSAADLAALEQTAVQKSNGNGSAHVNSNGSTAKKTVVTKEAEAPLPDVRRPKSVRFASTVESTTFAKSDPPHPSPKDVKADTSTPSTPSTPRTPKTPRTLATAEIVNKEHLQLAPEEAFFLAYAVGALRVVDEAGRAFSNQELFRLFSAYASFPPGDGPASSNRFVTHYSVYHHFRSLGWTPRHGIKFGVDWLLYGKGPALDHAEFGVMVMADGGAAKPGPCSTRKSWHWLHSVNRVLSTVYKSMVLVYVDTSDVPDMPPAPADADVDVTALLRAVKIRSVMVRRWSSNRNRD